MVFTWRHRRHDSIFMHNMSQICHCFVYHHGRLFTLFKTIYRELKWLGGRRHLARHKFAYLTMKNNSFARFACASSFFFFKHFVKWPVLKLSGQRQHLTTDFHYLHSISKPLTPILFQLVHILPTEQFGIMGKWLHKREVTFSDVVLPLLDFVLAPCLSSLVQYGREAGLA